MKTQPSLHEKTGLLFVAGAGLDARIWSRVASSLDHPCLLAQFPNRGGTPDTRKSLSLNDYVAHLKEQAEAEEPRKWILVAHSLGGVPALQLAAELGDRVVGFVAVGAAIPRPGGSFLSTLPLPKRLLLSAILRMAGTKPPEAAIRAGLCSDLSAEQAAEIVHGFVPEALRVYTDHLEVSAPPIPKLYIKLLQDKEFGLPLQERMIANLAPDRVEALNTGHLPMLSDPDGLRTVLECFLSSVDVR